jgi:hypothetical protein
MEGKECCLLANQQIEKTFPPIRTTCIHCSNWRMTYAKSGKHEFAMRKEKRNCGAQNAFGMQTDGAKR